MSEIDEIGHSVTRAAAAVLSAALITARLVMQRRAELAEQARRGGERRQRQVAARLHAERELAAVAWQRVNLHGWMGKAPREVAEVWASAASWAPYDDRAREALESLNSAAERLGALPAEAVAAMSEAADYEGLAVLLARGAGEARAETDQHRGAATGAQLDEQAAAQNDAAGLDVVIAGHPGVLAGTLDTNSELGAAHEAQGTAAALGDDATGAASAATQIYAEGADAAQVAGMSFSEPTELVVRRAHQSGQARGASRPSPRPRRTNRRTNHQPGRDDPGR